MEKLLGSRAEIFDMDDTLVRRKTIIRVFSALKSRNPLNRNHHPFARLEDLPQVNHQRTEGRVTGIRGRWMLASHIRRVVIPVMRDRLIQSAEEGAHIYVLTGRSSDSDWYDGTKQQLEREGILPYVPTPDRRLHTPGSRHTTVSKIHGVYIISQNYESTRLNDDHWPTIEFGAGLLPEVDFSYVYHGFPSIYPSRSYLEAHSNISVIDLTRKT